MLSRQVNIGSDYIIAIYEENFGSNQRQINFENAFCQTCLLSTD
jgi:hypothetical protein